MIKMLSEMLSQKVKFFLLKKRTSYLTIKKAAHKQKI
jgi:hypothetical protein